MKIWMEKGIGLDIDRASELLVAMATVATKGWLTPGEQRDLYEMACALADEVGRLRNLLDDTELRQLREFVQIWLELCREEEQRFFPLKIQVGPVAADLLRRAKALGFEIPAFESRNNAD